MNPEEWVPLAEIARPHGIKGEVRLRLFNRSSDLLLDQEEVLVRLANGEEHEVSVDKARRADDAILMKLFSIDDRNRAEEVRGAIICVKRKDFPPPEEGEFYTVDVIGAEVFMGEEKLGVVHEVMDYPTIQVMVVRAEDGEWEIPISEGFIASVDAENKRVEVVSMEGLEKSGPPKPKPPKEPYVPRHHKKRAAKKAEPSE